MTAMSAYAGGIAIGAVMTLTLLRRAFRGVQRVRIREQLTRIWVSSAATLMLANGFLVLLYTVDVILLGALESTTTAGLYSVASKLAILVLFVMNAVQAIGGPLLAEAYAARRTVELRRVIRMFNALTAVSAIPAAAILALGAEWFLGIFGEGFRTAAPALRILALMQVLNVLTGPVGILMSMTGRQRNLALLLAAGFAMHFVLCVVLIPKYGLIGAAWSALAAHAAWNLAGAVIVWRVAGIDCSVLDWLRRFQALPSPSGIR
jgi:O-antigen/teichoic acid export membrane protein